MNNNQTSIIQIDFVDFMWKLLMQWKAILTLCIIMAILVSGIKYTKDNKEYNNAVSQQKEAEREASLPAEDRINAALDLLPEEQQQDVLFVLQQQEYVNSQKQYLADSIWINTDPTSQRQLRIKYMITDTSGVGLQAISDSYSTYLRRDDVLNELREVISPDSKLEYISELVEPENKENKENKTIGDNDSSTVYTVKIVLPDDTDSDKVITVVESAISDAHAELYADSENQYRRINVEDGHFYNESVNSRRYSITNNVNNLINSINNAKNNLSAEQKTVLETITAIKDAEDKAAVNENIATDVTSESNTLEKPGISIKYALIGFILGAFIYAGISFVIMIMKKEVSSVSLVQGITGSRLLGDLYTFRKAQGLSSLLTSRKVAEWRYGDKLDTSKQIDSIVSTMCSVSTHNENPSIALLLCGTDKRFDDYVSAIVNQCKSTKNIKEITVLEADNMEEKELNTIKSVLYIVNDESKINKVSELVSLCKSYDLEAQGSLYFAEL